MQPTVNLNYCSYSCGLACNLTQLYQLRAFGFWTLIGST
uniref:Uncharacterized protein n=1 Tax=Rhizophora mucronata TaxID=61149 RepID=A0A2P2IIA0_RHIMU